MERMLLNEVIFQGVRILQEGTLLQTYQNKNNNHVSKSNTHVTVGSIIIIYVSRLSVHYPLP